MDREIRGTATAITGTSLDRIDAFLKKQPLIADSFHLESSLRYGCQVTVEILGCHNALVGIESETEVRVIAGYSDYEDIDIRRHWTVPKEQTITYHAVVSRRPVQWETHPITACVSPDQPDMLQRLQNHAREHCIFACPLILSTGEAIGALIVNTGNTGRAKEEDVLIASLVAATMAAALEANRNWVEAISRRAQVAHKVVAQQVHDTLAQDISALSMKLDTALAEANGLGKVEKTLQEAKSLCRRVNSGARSLMAANASGFCEVSDLRARLESEVERTAQAIGCRFALSLPRGEDLDDASPEACDQVALFVHEALINASKHALPTAGFIRIRRSGTEIVATVQNNGVVPGQPQVGQGSGTRFGLANLSEMATRLGGKLIYFRNDVEGTFTVRQTIPARGHGYASYSGSDC